MSDRLQFLKDILYPVVRIRSKRSGGSATVVYSQTSKNNPKKFDTFLLTNWHVVASLISVSQKYNSFLKRDMPEETRGVAEVDFFRYFDGSYIEGVYSMKAKIEAYNQDEDLALLRLESSLPAEFIANLPPRSRIDEIQLADGIFAVGAAMGHQPMITDGMLNYLDEEIDDQSYWIGSAPIIFGNSGGALFSENRRELIGIPSRIELVGLGFSIAPITHLGMHIPFTRIYDWLDSEFYQFIYDSEFNIDQCNEDRDIARNDSQRINDLLSLSGSEDV